MFSSFTARLQSEIETLKLVLDMNERLRALVFPPSNPLEPGVENAQKSQHSAAPLEVDQNLREIRAAAPSKSEWHVYDHCAAFTRLYAVYEQFVEDLATDYLRMLPELYHHYEELPESVTKQHRVGIGQILLKLGKDGPYKELEERQIIKDLSHGLLGSPDYVLLRDAFLIDPQNYRAEMIVKLFSYLGIADAWSWIEKHPLMISFMQNHRDANETPKTVLHDFVEYRNKASHTLVADIVSVEEIKSIADFILVLSETLAQLVMRQVIQRKKVLGQIFPVGLVVHKFSNRIVGVRAVTGTIARGNEIVVLQKRSCFKTTIESIEFQRKPYETIQTEDGQEIGVALGATVSDGAELMKTTSAQATIVESPPEPLSPDDYPVTGGPESSDSA